MALETSQKHGTSEVKDSKDLADLHLSGNTSTEPVTFQKKDKNEDSSISKDLAELCMSGNTSPEKSKESCQIMFVQQ